MVLVELKKYRFCTGQKINLFGIEVHQMFGSSNYVEDPGI